MQNKIIYINKIYGWRKVCYKNYTLWIKGIIYNYSDTYILARLLKVKLEFIKNFLHSIDGHFAMILDKPDQIFIIVDRIASIPIFFFYDDKKFLVSPFATKLKDKFKKIINKKQLISLAMSSYSTGDETIYKNLYTLKAGTFGIFNKRDSKFIKKIFYEYKNWEIDNSTNFNSNIKKLSKLNLEVINKIYKYSLKKNKKIAIPLSAGFDSRLIASGLKTLGAKNVLCFSYGYKNNHESLASKKISEKLGFEWEFVELNNDKIYKLFKSKSFNKFRSEFDTLCCTSDLTEFLAIKELRDKKKLNNCIIVNGNSGDFISGGHILDFKIEKNFSKTIENLISVFIKKHYRLWNFLLTKNNEKIIKKLLLNEIIHTEIFKKIKIYNSHSLIEYLEYYNRQSKHLSSKQRTYEYFNYEWAQPLWDKDYIEFWRVVRKKYKQKQNLYFETLKKDNFGDVWSDAKWFRLKESAKTTIPIFRFLLRPLAKFLFALKGKTAWHQFETRYMLYFTDILCSMGIKKYRDIINDNRGFRNFLSFHTEDYLNKKKIKINLLKFKK